MKTHYTVSLAMLVGFGLGGLAVKVLHAQARPPGYMIAEVDVIDEAGYKKFVEGTSVTVPASGGRYIVRGGRTSKLSDGKDPINVRREPSPNDRIELPRRPKDGVSSLYPRAAGRPSGNVQLWSPFLSEIERLGIDLNEVLFGAGSPPP